MMRAATARVKCSVCLVKKMCLARLLVCVWLGDGSWSDRNAQRSLEGEYMHSALLHGWVDGMDGRSVASSANLQATIILGCNVSLLGQLPSRSLLKDIKQFTTVRARRPIRSFESSPSGHIGRTSFHVHVYMHGDSSPVDSQGSCLYHVLDNCVTGNRQTQSKHAGNREG
ncbi:hypothetical protein BD289DRAFT_122201 [Coniella lustricola]|uniref:Secreted protein n=1 Tax=Coniella lustricola TaxID=2025994 RepID=A0A2T2ZWJ4_9PEZI|nr:hypothetical protein BD289DRAFT_122201 [Coniella lustricola]